MFECSPEFWKNNLDLLKVVGVDYNNDFDLTFGKDHFEADITLEQAIKRERGWPWIILLDLRVSKIIQK